MTATPNHTPMMQQYLRIKSEYPDTLLFYRMGEQGPNALNGHSQPKRALFMEEKPDNASG